MPDTTTTSQHLVDEIHSFIQSLPNPEQEVIQNCLAALREIVNTNGQYGQVALALVATENAVQAGTLLDQLAQTYPAAGVETVEVHNCWTIYGLDEDGGEAEQPLACLGRPQDWGDPKYTYHRFRFDWLTAQDGILYKSHVHCWTDLKRTPDEFRGLFASLIVQLLMPGLPAELCGRDYLHEEDFWDEAWGEQPPAYEGEENVF